MVSAWIHAGLSTGVRLPKYSNASAMLGLIQIDLRPDPSETDSLQLNAKLSPRRSFAQITTCRWASTRSSIVAESLESYVSMPTVQETTTGSARECTFATRRAPELGDFGSYDSSLTVRQIPETRIIEDLQGAGYRGELVAHFQPQVALPGRRVVGVEALARWNHPEFGSISPTDFIPAAESGGLISTLGHHMLELATRQVAAWRSSGLHLDLAVNVSPSQLADHDYCDDVLRVLDSSGLPTASLTLEITETQPIGDLTAAVECLEHLREHGVGVSIDDFGAGHSSLEQFRNLPATELKLDQSIIQGSVDGARVQLAAVLAEARERGLRIVAEGVETLKQLARAEQLGCDRAQGFLIGRPVDAETLARSLR